MRQGTGSNSKMSPSSPTRLFSPTANYLSPAVSSSKRLKRRAKLVSPPLLQQLPQHCPSILTSCPLSPAVINVATPPNNCSAQGKNATIVAAKTIILPCADPKDPSDHPMTQEAQSTQADCPEVPGQGASKMTGANPPADVTTNPQAVALPTVLPILFQQVP